MTREEIQDYTLKITQSSNSEIIVILFDMAKKYLKDAGDAFEADNRQEYRKNCMSAQKVIQDLVGSLDFSYELAMSLYRIYEFMGREISMAVIKNNMDMLFPITNMLTKLQESFVKIASEDKSGPAMGNTQAVYAGLTYGRKMMMDSVSLGADNRGFKA